jgi:hypothetical protein
VSERDNRPVWSGSRRHYEVWFATMSDGRTGYWIRTTVHGGPEPHARVWFARFDRQDPSRIVALNRRVPLEEWATEPDAVEVRAGGAVFASGRLHGAIEGSGHRAEWDLSFPTGGPTYRLLPGPLYHGGLAPTKPLSPNIDTDFSGTVTVDGQTADVEWMPGQQGHLHGRAHAERWTWAHCSAFQGEGSEGTVVHALVAQGRRGPITTPFTTFVGVRWRNRWLRFTRVSRRRDTALGVWRIDLSNDRYRLTGAVAGDPALMVQARYEDPDGTPRWCHNTEVGSSRFVLFERAELGWDAVADLTSEGTTHAEWAGRTPAPGTFVPHLDAG